MILKLEDRFVTFNYCNPLTHFWLSFTPQLDNIYLKYSGHQLVFIKELFGKYIYITSPRSLIFNSRHCFPWNSWVKWKKRRKKKEKKRKMETTYLYCWCRSVVVVVPMATISDGREPGSFVHCLFIHTEYMARFAVLEFVLHRHRTLRLHGQQTGEEEYKERRARRG
jgi:hypothetical protein